MSNHELPASYLDGQDDQAEEEAGSSWLLMQVGGREIKTG